MDTIEKKILARIDARREEIIAFGRDLFDHGELGYKEYRTAGRFAQVLDGLGIPHEDGLALTGVKGRLKPQADGPVVALIGEMDALRIPGHPHYNPETQGAHCCGHNAQMAGIVGAAMGLCDPEIMQALEGNVLFFAVPSEEYGEVEFKNSLMAQGKIRYGGGKSELLRIGAFDEVDMAVTHHASNIGTAIGGGTSNIQPAMEKGEFDLYPEYTSSGWILVLGHEAGEVSDEEMFAKLQQEYEEKFGMTWIGLYGQNNTYAIVVRSDTAEEYGLETCSDLAEVSGELTFGGNPDYIERADGLPGVSEAYGFAFKDIRDIDIGLKYAALRSGDIDVTNGYTTDAQISQDDVKVLEDDKNYQVNYYCSTVVREDALEKFPKLEETLELMDGILTDKTMAELNYQVEEEGRDEAEVAEEFLVSAGLIEG